MTVSNASKKKKIIAHPILFALYPILFLYAHNIKEAYISQIFFPLLFSIVFASLLWGGLFLAVKDKVKSAIISTIFIFLFFLYGHIFDQLAIEKSQLPDIYYIILDGYASLSTIKTLYHYDDTSFARELKELEFYIAGESRTQYKMTEQSLASSLNMCYTEKEDNFYAMIRDNQVVEILKKAGYKIIAFLDKDEQIFNSKKQKNTQWMSLNFLTFINHPTLNFTKVSRNMTCSSVA
jgi:hypothetical protein